MQEVPLEELRHKQTTVGACKGDRLLAKEILKAQLWAQFEQSDFAKFITVARAEHLMAV